MAPILHPNPAFKRTVYKYELFNLGVFGSDRTRHELPILAKPLHVALVGGRKIMGWFEVPVDSDKLARPRTHEVEFIIVGTGHEVPDNGVHLGTVIEHEFVWHMYMRS